MIKQEEFKFSYDPNRMWYSESVRPVTSNHFELEQQIFDCWHVTDDLDVLFEAATENTVSGDKISNIVLGLKELYQLKFERLFNTFENMIQKGEM